MPTFTKAILRPKDYHSPDGVVSVDAARLKRWEQSFKRLSEAGLTVPMRWDHSDDPAENKPLTKKQLRSAKNTVGKLVGVKATADGAELTLDITDPKAAERAQRNEVFVSPVILSEFFDGNKTRHEDVFVGVDMVDLPVDHGQGPFVESPASIACGFRLGLGTKVYKLADNPFAKDDDEEDDEEEGEADTDTDVEDSGEGDPIGDAEDPGDGMVDKDAANDKDATGNQLKALVEKIVQEMDVHFPEGVDHTSPEGMTLLLTAVLNRHTAKKEDEEPEEEDPMANQIVPQAPDMAVMSLASQTALRYAERQHRQQLALKLEALCASGRCTPHEQKTYAKSVQAVRLSLTRDGEPVASDVDKFIASREAVPEGTFWDDKSRIRMAQALKLPGHVNLNEEPEESEIAAIAAWAGGRAKRPTD